MNLKSLDYLSSQEGQTAFALSLTELINKFKADTAETSELEFDNAITESVDKHYKLFKGDQEKRNILFSGIQSFIRVQAVAFKVGAGLSTDDSGTTLQEYIGGIIYAAAHLNGLNDLNKSAQNLSKRDFIRYSVFLYDMSVLHRRNIDRLNKDIPSKDY